MDLLITQPAITTELIHSHRILPMLTLANRDHMSEFGSVFITQSNNSKINKLEDIEGKSIAAVAPLALGGWLAGYNELFDNNIDPIKDNKVTFLGGNQKNVINSILENKYDVGVIRTGMLEKLSKK
ncbi:MAG: PhnD/SsuA/transferrin family substrate-binding protein, partial [Campylobacterota bacterium]|nr:PhnD/SsuA/transferrin family substrate-binding protein [Campylobacterota bacterium]